MKKPETFEIIDKRGSKKVTRVYDTDKSYRKHIELPEGPAIFRDQLEAEHHGMPIKKTYLYLPDTNEVPHASMVPLIGMGGVMTVGGDYAMTAATMAQEGHMYVTHNSPRGGLSTREQLFNKETRENPFRYTAEVGHKVILATLMHLYRDLDIDTNEVDVTCHSYGGMTGSELASFDPHVRYLILQDVAGIIEGSLKAHASGLPGMVREGIDTYKHIRNSIDDMNPDLFDDHKEHVLPNILLAIREFYALTRDPDLSKNVRMAKENGVKVGGVFFGKSAFFPLLLTQMYAEQKQIFDDFIVLEDARHVEANINHRRNTDVQLELINRLGSLPLAA